MKCGWGGPSQILAEWREALQSSGASRCRHPAVPASAQPLVLSRVHWVRPELVAEVKFLAWTEDNLLRQVVYDGLREDKPAGEVRREVPRAKP